MTSTGTMPKNHFEPAFNFVGKMDPVVFICDFAVNIEAILRPRIGKQAKRIGLVHQVAPLDELFAVAERYAQRLALLSPQALSSAKTAVLEGMDLSLDDGLALERRTVARLLTSHK